MFAKTSTSRRKIALAMLLATGSGVVLAQDDNGPQGLSMSDASGSYEVSGVEVDVTGKSAVAAREAGWRLAQRKGWAMLSKQLGGGSSGLSDGTLDAMVSGIVVENEQIGPNRYVAKLGVLFNRGRAGSLLGVAGQSLRSPAMLVLPLQYSGGTGQIFEQRTDWAEAWTRYRTGNSVVDYVRPAGSGPDALLLNLGQTGRPGRHWWRTILDQYGALDVLVPAVRLYRQWPGGPVIGAFEARHGPDNRLVTKFSLRVNTGDGLRALLDAGVKRIDEAYQAALRGGMLSTDAGLSYVPPPPPGTVVAPSEDDAPIDQAITTPGAAMMTINIQFDTPGVAAVTSGEAALRVVPGVRSAMTSSLALGGVSVMRVGFEGDPAALQAALEARGWIVQGAGTTLRIRRPLAPPTASPPADNATGG
ncbi:heavy-metal-associated domain-containing protein [Sphingomonas qilianensis]|uniref:Heavy-metal-associated domain-containing protein n=1 Tax=Sphingomonas qilianensis TaxID=1736690 RepID=A0ABU9XPA4_9SPHN